MNVALWRSPSGLQNNKPLSPLAVEDIKKLVEELCAFSSVTQFYQSTMANTHRDILEDDEEEEERVMELMEIGRNPPNSNVYLL